MPKHKPIQTQQSSPSVIAGIALTTLAAAGLIGYTISELAKLMHPTRHTEVNTDFFRGAAIVAGVVGTAIVAKTQGIFVKEPKEPFSRTKAIKEAMAIAETAPNATTTGLKRRKPSGKPSTVSSGSLSSSGYDASREGLDEIQHTDASEYRRIANSGINDLIEAAKSHLGQHNIQAFKDVETELKNAQTKYLANLKADSSADPKTSDGIEKLKSSLEKFGKYVRYNTDGSHTTMLAFVNKYSEVMDALAPERSLGR